jgi:hypothetical protein
MSEHQRDSAPTPPSQQAGGPLRLAVAVLVIVLGIALIALLVFGRGG